MNNTDTFLSFDSEKQTSTDWDIWPDTNNPDISTPWDWSFNFPNGSGYYEFYSIGKKSGSIDETSPGSADAKCKYDNPPTIELVSPANGSTGVSISPVLNITVADQNGDNMNITWLSNSSGSWQTFGTNNSVGNGTYHQTMSNASVNGQWWYWKVNVSDGTGYTESSVYKFYTGCQSKIVNTGSTNIKGYLLIQVQFYNETSESWVVADDTINETSPRTFLWADPGGSPGQHILALDTIFNGNVNTSDLSGFGNGTYRIYAAFRDPEGNILECDDETELVATYEFEITF